MKPDFPHTPGAWQESHVNSQGTRNGQPAAGVSSIVCGMHAQVLGVLRQPTLLLPARELVLRIVDAVVRPRERAVFLHAEAKGDGVAIVMHPMRDDADLLALL